MEMGRDDQWEAWRLRIGIPCCLGGYLQERKKVIEEFGEIMMIERKISQEQLTQHK